MNTERYYYNRLSSAAQEAYDTIYRGLSNMIEPEIKVGLMPSAEIGNLVRALELDNPELFYVNWCAPIVYAEHGGKMAFRFQYLYNREETEKLKCEIDLLARSLAGIAKLSKTLAVHDWFVDNVTYDSEGLRSLIRSPNMFSAVGPIENRKAVCLGISKLACCLLRKKGVEAIVVTGCHLESRTPHAWNGVWLDGGMRHVDITFDIGASRRGERSRKYFCLSRDEIVKDRSINVF